MDPVGWVGQRLGEHLWSKQREIITSVRDHRRTAVHSAHETGKSFVAARLVAWWLENHPVGEAFVVTTAPSAPQVRAILWREINRAHAKGQLSGRTNQTEWWRPTPTGGEELVAYGRKPDEFSPGAFQGIHARYVLVVFDECGGIPKSLWDAGDSLIANERSRFLAIGNPDDPQSEFAEVCKPGSGWHTVGIGYADTPNFTDEAIPDALRDLLIGPTWVEEKRRKWGATNPMFVAKCEGEFPDVASGGLISPRLIKDAQARRLSLGEPVELGVDVGAGGDRNVVCARWGPVARIIRTDQQPDTMKTLGNVLADQKQTGAARVKIDKNGVGKGAYDRAREQDRRDIIGINVGEGARDNEQFENLRAELAWGLRERFQDGDIDLDPHDEDLAAELVGLKFERSSRGRTKLESKADLRRHGKPSPDHADALMLAFAPAGRQGAARDFTSVFTRG